MQACAEKIMGRVFSCAILWVCAWLLCGIACLEAYANYGSSSYSPPEFNTCFNLSQQSCFAAARQFIQDHVNVNVHNGGYYAGPTRRVQSVPVTQRCSEQDYAAYFNAKIYQGGMEEQDVLSLYELYESSEFVSYLKTLSGYDEHIVKLHDKLNNCCSDCAKAVVRKMGYSKRVVSSFLDAQVVPIKKKREQEAVRLRAEKQEQKKREACEVQERVEQKAREERVQAEQAALWKRQEEERLAIVARQAARERYAAVDVSDVCMRLLEQHADRTNEVRSLDDVVLELFGSADISDYQIPPEVQVQVDSILEGMPTTDNKYAYMIKLVMLEHVLRDMQQQVVSRTDVPVSLFERSRELFERGVCTFVKRLNPITQIKSMGHLALSTARFISTVSVGAFYLSPEEYQSRFDGYWETIESFSPKNLAQLSAEQWVDFVANCAADMVFCAGVTRAAAYIKELNAVVRAREHAGIVARRFRRAAKNQMQPHAVAETAEGVVLRAVEEGQEVSSGVKAATGVSSGASGGERVKKAIVVAGELRAAPVFELGREAVAEALKEWEIVVDAYRRMNRTGYGKALEGVKINLDVAHISGKQPWVNKRGMLKMGGYHHDLKNWIENRGVLQLVRKAGNEAGFYGADVYFKDVFVKYSSFFPSHWTRKEVWDYIFKVYDKAKELKIEPVLDKGGYYTIKVPMGPSLTIELHITADGLIRTAFPKFE